MTPSKFKSSALFCLRLFVVTICCYSTNSFTQTTIGASPYTVPATGSYKIPVGVTAIEVYMWGGGGGSGGAGDGTLYGAGGGGGGGAFVKLSFTGLASEQSFSVGIGNRGAAGGNNADGGDGGNTTFTILGNTYVANGGKKGLKGSGASGAGGAGGAAIPLNAIVVQSQKGGNGGAGSACSSALLTCGGGGGGAGGSNAAGNNAFVANTISYPTITAGSNCANWCIPQGGLGGGSSPYAGGNGATLVLADAKKDPGSANRNGVAATIRGGGAAGGNVSSATTRSGAQGGPGEIIIVYVSACSAPTSVLLSGFSTPICSGTAPGTFTATATGGSPTSYSYLWYKDGVSTGVTTQTYTPGNLTATTSIYCAVSTGAGCTTNSSTQSIVVNATPSAPTVTSPQTLCSPATVANLVATGTALKWYAAASGGTALLSTASLTSGTYYVSQTVGGCESARTSVSVTVQPSQVVDVAISASPSANICIGTTVTFTATPVNGGSSPVYQWKVNGGNAGTNSNTFTTASLMNGDVVTCEMTSNAGACLIGSPAMSDPFTVVMPTPALLLSANESKTCVVNGSNWVRFYGNTGRLLGAIHPNSQNLGEVTMQTFVASPGVMNACDQPTNPLYSTVYMGRTWVMNSSQYPTGASFPSNVSVRLPFNNTELAALNSAADAVTIANPNDGGTSAPAALPNLMLTKITGATEDGVATAADCASTIIGITSNAGTGTNYTSILNTSYLDFSVGQFSEFFLHKNNANMSLPVELISFRGTCTTDGAHLTWQTASEINNDYFVVQRSRDGVAWEVIGQVQGSGSTTQLQTYDFVDQDVFGEHYYRLIQVDLNGDQYEKHPIFVDCAEESVTVTVFPNPTTSSFVLNISGAISPSSLSFSIVDITGKWIDSQELQVEAGGNTFLYDRDLAPGTYVVQVQTADEVQLVKLVVRN